MGITPAGRAGAVGPPVPLTPIDQDRTLAALRRLRPPDGAFVLRLNRFFWSDGWKGIHHFSRLTRLYTRHGYRVELQLRYHPRPEQEGRIGAWVRFVRRVVRRFGPNPDVVGLQVTNEVNFYEFAPDASDSAFEGARDALIRGVEAAHRLVRRRGFDQLRVGFNWAYRTDPAREAASGVICASREAGDSRAPWTGWGWTPTPEPCSHPWSRRPTRAIATAWSAR